MKKLSLKCVIALISLVMAALALFGCGQSNDITTGVYIYEDSSIIIKQDSILSLQNVDLTQLQQETDQASLNIDVSEKLSGDLEFTVPSSEPSWILVQIIPGVNATFIYDFNNQTISFLGIVYVLKTE